MSLLAVEVQDQVKEAFAIMAGPVNLVIFTQENKSEPGCKYCQETQELVEEVAALSDKIHVEIIDLDKDQATAAAYQIDKTPALVVMQGGAQPKDFGIRFYGIPSGYEFSSLIEDILFVSQGKTDLGENTLQQLAKLDQPVHIQVFVTPSCSYCPPAVILAHKLAIASEKVTADMVESMEFPDLANRYQVYGVPRTVINEVIHIEGSIPEAALISELMQVLDNVKMELLQKEWAIEVQ